mmetsp:Transcript_50440/g.113425  ORF Transcript_50440/g.113425 Transcript_50440/m.113425 type:complete len:209 (-) Transcript_50440:264-890(-)
MEQRRDQRYPELLLHLLGWPRVELVPHEEQAGERRGHGAQAHVGHAGQQRGRRDLLGRPCRRPLFRLQQDERAPFPRGHGGGQDPQVFQGLQWPVLGDVRGPHHGGVLREVEPLPPEDLHLGVGRLDREDVGPLQPPPGDVLRPRPGDRGRGLGALLLDDVRRDHLRWALAPYERRRPHLRPLHQPQRENLRAEGREASQADPRRLQR